MTRCLLVIRHGIAEEPVDAARAGRDEFHRQLTPDGRRKMHAASRGLKELIERIDLLASSPLTRALETADILAEAYPGAKRVQHPGLSPGIYHSELLGWFMGQDGVVALVGHEPDLSQWIGYLTSGEPRSLVEMKKGGICRLDMSQNAMTGEARISWLLTSRQLRTLGDF